MPFIESDFLLALLKGEDWLKGRALKAYEKYKGSLWTSGFSIAEVLLLAEELHLDPERLVVSIYEIVDVRGLDETVALRAAHYMKESRATTFDALHAAHAQDDMIISSDSVYDRLGLDRLKLEAL